MYLDRPCFCLKSRNMNAWALWKTELFLKLKNVCISACGPDVFNITMLFDLDIFKNMLKNFLYEIKQQINIITGNTKLFLRKISDTSFWSSMSSGFGGSVCHSAYTGNGVQAGVCPFPFTGNTPFPSVVCIGANKSYRVTTQLSLV